MRSQLICSVLKIEENLVPVRIHHCSHCKGTLVIFAKPCSLTGKLVTFKDFRTGVVMTAHFGSHTAFIITAFTVDKLAVVVEQKVVSVCLILCYLSLKGSITSLTFIWRIIRIAVIHSFIPPSKKEESISSYALTCLIDDTVHIGIFEKILSILMLEDHSLPALYLLHPLRGTSVIPPCINPLTINYRSDVPCARIRRNHIGITFPRLTAEAMRIFEESELKLILATVFIGIHTQSVPCILERIIMRSEIKSLIFAEKAEAVHEHLVAVLDISLTEDLLRALVW